MGSSGVYGICPGLDGDDGQNRRVPTYRAYRA